MVNDEIDDEAINSDGGSVRCCGCGKEGYPTENPEEATESQQGGAEPPLIFTDDSYEPGEGLCYECECKQYDDILKEEERIDYIEEEGEE